jgi:hypothetical protein
MFGRREVLEGLGHLFTGRARLSWHKNILTAR